MAGEYIIVSSEGGIINDIWRRDTLEEAVWSINCTLYNDGFDHEGDDARIFGPDDKEAYSYPHEYAELCEEYELTDENYADIAVKVWKGELGESEEDLKVYLKTL
jgi:hypothetical protein